MSTPKIDKKCRFFVDNRKNGGIIYNMNIYLTLLAVLESVISLWTRCFPSCLPAEGFFSLMSIPQIDNPIDNHANKHIIKSKMPSAGDNDPEAAIASTPEKPGCYSQPGFFFSTTIYIRPRPWERMQGNGKRRYMNPDQRQYYSDIYMALYDAGCPKLNSGREYGVNLVFHRKRDRSVPDKDNLCKAIMDAGQISKWDKSAIKVMDLWDDKVFAEGFTKRILNAQEDKIEIEIYEIE